MNKTGIGIRTGVVFAILLFPAMAFAWGPHPQITRAAVEVLCSESARQTCEEWEKTLGKGALASIGRDLEAYCWMPDQAHQDLGAYFANDYLLFRALPFLAGHGYDPKSSPTLPQICGIYFRRALQALRTETLTEASRWMGTMTHYLEDAGAPPHAKGISGPLHGPMENWLNASRIAIPGYTPRLVGVTEAEAVKGIEKRVQDLITFSAKLAEEALPLVQKGESERAQVEPILLQAALECARVLADALHTLFTLRTREQVPPTSLKGIVHAPEIPFHKNKGACVALLDNDRFISAARKGQPGSAISEAATDYFTHSAADGSYIFHHIPAGVYRVAAWKLGARWAISEPVSLRAGETAVVDISLPATDPPNNLLRNPDATLHYLSPDAPEYWSRGSGYGGLHGFPVSAVFTLPRNSSFRLGAALTDRTASVLFRFWEAWHSPLSEILRLTDSDLQAGGVMFRTGDRGVHGVVIVETQRPLKEALDKVWVVEEKQPAINYACEFYVAPNGNDAWSGKRAEHLAGTNEGPFATLQRAQSAAREWRAQNPGAQLPLRVVVSEGTYYLTEPLVFTPQDSGSEKSPTVFAAADGAAPVVSGGREIRGFRRDPQKSDLWVAHLPEVQEGKWFFTELFINGRRYTRARHPNTADYWFSAEKKLEIENATGGFVYAQGDMKRWENLSETEVVLLRVWDVSRYRLTSVDETTRVARFRVPPDLKSITHWGEHHPYYLENNRAFLDTPGEWFLDRSSGMLTVWALPGDDLGKAQVVAPVLSHLMRFAGTADAPVQHLRFEGLDFRHCAWSLPPDGYDGHQADVVIGGGVEGDYARHIQFRRCSFREQGRYAINLRRGCRNIVIDGCHFTDLGAGGVLLGDFATMLPPAEDETRDNTVSNCEIHHTGQVFPSAVGIGVGYAHHNRIAGNHVHHTSYTGISVGWGWTDQPNGAHDNIIERNYLHDIQLVMGDGAAIYTLSRQPGTVIRSNVIHDVFGAYTFGSGIYLDNNSSEILVENNLVARTIGASLVNNAVGRDNIIRNNIFALAATDVFHINRCKNNRIEGNIIYIREGSLGDWTDESVSVIDRNLYWFAGQGEFIFPGGRTFAEWQSTGRDKNSIIADPMFGNVSLGDFTLKPASPALTKLGFQPLPYQRTVGAAPPDWRDDPRLVKLFRLQRGVRSRSFTPQLVNVEEVGQQRKVSLSPRAPASPSSPATLEGLVAWWSCDEVTTNMIPGRLHGEVLAGVTATTGVVGNAFLFDGNIGKIIVPYALILNLSDALTISAWIRCAPVQGERGNFGIVERTQVYRLMLLEREAPYSITFSLRSDKNAFFGVTSKREVPAEKWTFVVATFDSASGKVAIYLDGKLSAQADIAAGTKVITQQGGGLQIGLRDDRAYFRGAIDEIKIYDRALAGQEIADEFERIKQAKMEQQQG